MVWGNAPNAGKAMNAAARTIHGALRFMVHLQGEDREAKGRIAATRDQATPHGAGWREDRHSRGRDGVSLLPRKGSGKRWWRYLASLLAASRPDRVCHIRRRIPVGPVLGLAR